MPSRNCETRPVSWRISYNRELAEAVKELGFEIWAFWIGCITSCDNLGRLEGDAYQLKGMFFPDDLYPQVTVDKIRVYTSYIHRIGLVLHYKVRGISYLQLPKVGVYSKLVGNMVAKSDFPEPPKEIIDEWESRMNDVYTPPIRCIYDKKKRISNVLPEGQGKGQGKGEDNVSRQKISRTRKPLVDNSDMKETTTDFLANEDDETERTDGKKARVKKRGELTPDLCSPELIKYIDIEKMTPSAKASLIFAMCPTMKKRGWCINKKICQSIITNLSDKIKKAKGVENPFAYSKKTVENLLNENAEEISKIAKKAFDV